ncbi:PIN domain-containing protein [Patescibacteria group bacterium]|nr:PIN domain-containing protein [Patescibacteria group bacterium]
MKVFVDTGAWLALQIKNDLHHHAARKFSQKLEGRRAHLFTNSFVLSEAYTRLIYDVNLEAARVLRQKVIAGSNKGNLTLIEVNSMDRNQAWEILRKFSDHKLSFTDATIIANFEKYRMDIIFTFDRHFEAVKLPTQMVN